MLHVGRIVGGNGIGSGCSTMPSKPREGDFLFSSLFVGQSPLQGDAPFRASLMSAKWHDPTERSAVSPQGHGAVSMMALGQRAIGSLRISCIGTSSVMTLLHISSIGTSPVAMDSRGCPRPASSLMIGGTRSNPVPPPPARKAAPLVFFSTVHVTAPLALP
jgi:hypothetical protein